MARTQRDSNPASGTDAAPKKPKSNGRMRQMWDVFQMTRKYDPSVVWWMIAAVVGIFGVATAVGLLTNIGLFYCLFFALMLSAVAVMFILARKAETAAYSQIEGKPGAVASALGTIRRGWIVEQQPVAVNPQTQDMVFRVVGRPGVVLVGEGPHKRVASLLAKEEKRTNRLVPNVPIYTYDVGPDDDQVPLRKISMKVQRTRTPKGVQYLTKSEMDAVAKRLRALAGSPSLPIPKGVDPTKARPDRKGLRGR